MGRLYRTLIVIGLTFGIAHTGDCQTYRVDWCSVNSGAGLTSNGSHSLNCSLGQSSAGLVTDSNHLHWVGFWGGEVPDPLAVPGIGSVKLLADGSYVSLTGKIATSSLVDFDSFFYLEEADRSSGVRVAVPGLPVGGLMRGSVVNVIGTLGTTDAGERQLMGPVVIIVSSHEPIEPLGMGNRWVGGNSLGTLPAGQMGTTGGYGLNNVGLLIQTWGSVTEVGAGYVLIDDGANLPVRLQTSVLSAPPPLGDYVSTIGISSLHWSGTERLRLLLPRDDQDVIRRAP